MRMLSGLLIVFFVRSLFASGIEWKFESPRPEIAPQFESLKGSVLTLKADERSGLSGSWVAHLAVEPGEYYQFSASRRTQGVERGLVRRTAPVRIIWLTEKRTTVTRDEPSFASYRPGTRPRAEPEFPVDGQTDGEWTEVKGLYRAPSTARVARVELHFRWGAPHSQVDWSNVRLKRVAAPAPRKVRLAAIHYRPREGKTSADKRELFAPLVADAAKQKADLIVLPETLTFFGTGMSYVECAEPVPGPSTEYFGKLAKKHSTHIVAGILERDGHLVYNVSVLLGPDGRLIGKYRKVTLPRGEIEGGLTPGDSYPVFETSFGKVGMMICYDGFFPEVARQLSKNGAEVIAWPVWGCNPMLGAARACENHVYVVSSTYTDAANDWMITGIYGHDGRVMSQAKEWGSIAITEVDLSRPLHWHSLGDFKAQIERHRPPVPAE